MQTLIREKMRERLFALLPVMDCYSRGEPDFPDLATVWLDETQRGLAQLRCPEAALLSTLRGRLQAAREGFRDPSVPGDMTPRKALRAAACVYLGQAQEALRGQIAAISDKLDPLRAQMAQLVAVAQLRGPPLPLQPTEPREAWLQLVWSRLPPSDLTTLLTTTLPRLDRLYLLDEILGNVLEGRPADAHN